MTQRDAESAQRRETWGWRDGRTGQRVSMSVTRTREQAERELDEWRRRNARGGRPDLRDLIPHIEVYRIHPPGQPTSGGSP